MTEDELLLSTVKDKMNECDENSVITCTDFLDLRKQSIAVNYLKRTKGVKWILFGGYEEAERKAVIFLPFYVENFFDYIKDFPDALPWVVFRADKDGFSSLTHRDYLGALMGLGIKREKLGDIVIDDKGCYFFAMQSVSKFIGSNFSQAGRGTIKISIVEDFSEFKYTAKTVEKCCFLQSLRLDSAVAGIFSLSRSKASEFIEKGLVFVSDEQILKPDYHPNVGDKIVVKGKGRAIIKDDSSKSKKGRIALIVDVFI